MRIPTSPAERALCEKAYASTDPFAVARWERPGCKYIRVVDERTRGNLGLSFVFVVGPNAMPDAELLGDRHDQTVTLRDRDLSAPTHAHPGELATA